MFIFKYQYCFIPIPQLLTIFPDEVQLDAVVNNFLKANYFKNVKSLGYFYIYFITGGIF